MTHGFLNGTVHEAQEDLRKAIVFDPTVFDLWQKLTPLGRNEFICWVDDAKQTTTRQRRIQRTAEELLEGKSGHVAGLAAFTAPTKPPAAGSRTC